MDSASVDPATWFEEPDWFKDLVEGSWLKFKSLDELKEINQQVHPSRQLPEQVMRLHAKKVQVNRLASCHGNMSLVSIYGAPGYFIPEFFELKQLEPDPIDYDWSAELAKQST